MGASPPHHLWVIKDCGHAGVSRLEMYHTKLTQSQYDPDCSFCKDSLPKREFGRASRLGKFKGVWGTAPIEGEALKLHKLQNWDASPNFEYRSFDLKV